MTTSLETYAAVLAALSAGRERASTLRANGFDETSWAETDARFQAALNAEDAPEGEIPPLAQRFSKAFEAALDAIDQPPELDFETYAAITRRLRGGYDVGRAVQEGSFDLAAYLRSHRYWVKRIVQDPELRRRFEEG